MPSDPNPSLPPFTVRSSLTRALERTEVAQMTQRVSAGGIVKLQTKEVLFCMCYKSGEEKSLLPGPPKRNQRHDVTHLFGWRLRPDDARSQVFNRVKRVTGSAARSAALREGSASLDICYAVVTGQCKSKKYSRGVIRLMLETLGRQKQHPELLQPRSNSKVFTARNVSINPTEWPPAATPPRRSMGAMYPPFSGPRSSLCVGRALTAVSSISP
ncbi:hypothetical protein EYF80_007993 [Liparis tanakae]|uniref:Uncharacterized protein n=1 Tax=Liparis tanakae TaxID=230148 RepID=A0A4Z2IWD1_9TELE|nr:hypothetical protein EYF80_007993 [Liparis tanakae]